MKLVLPSMDYEQSYYAYMHELGEEERYPFPLDFDYADFGALLSKLNDFSAGLNLPQGFVPATTYWLVEQGQLLGVSNLRHYLNDRIRHAGGHIGLGIRPSRRGCGLGSLLLSLTLEKAVEQGIRPVHVHCHKHNVPSSRMIISNGGVLDSEILDGSELVQRYVINAM